MPYIHFTDEQKLRANSVDLAEFLRRQGEKLIPSGREKRLASDHSITVRGNEWFDHASEQGGHAISFVQQFYNLSYPEAVMKLLDGECAANYILTAPEPMEETKEFALPPASTSMRRMYAYLIQQRLIAWEVVNAFVKKGLIYESCEKSKNQTKEYHNAVFVGFDEHGVARHAHRRGIYTQGKSFRGNVTGCNPRYSFHWTGTGSKLYVFEAPVDMLAFITLYPDGWQSNSYVALCGTAEHAMLWMLEQNPQLEKVIFCLDHDAAGIEAAGRLAEILRTQGCLLAAPLLPQYKDWDEELKARCGRDAQPAREHPQSIVKEEVCSRIAEKGAGRRSPAGSCDTPASSASSKLSEASPREKNGLGGGCDGTNICLCVFSGSSGTQTAWNAAPRRSCSFASSRSDEASYEQSIHSKPNRRDHVCNTSCAFTNTACRNPRRRREKEDGSDVDGACRFLRENSGQVRRG